MTGLNANKIGLMAVLLFVSGGGIGLAWVGCGWWRQARTTRGGIPTIARIDRLAYTGPYLVGRFFASISYNDVKGSNQTAELALSSVQWNRLREGQSLSILYSGSDAQSVTLGGRKMRWLLQAAGITFAALGLLVAVLSAGVFTAGLFGWAWVR